MNTGWGRLFAAFRRPKPSNGEAGCSQCGCPPKTEAAPRKMDYPREKAIRRVFITEGCMICCACEAECPEVFKLDSGRPPEVMSAEFTSEAASCFQSHRENIEAAAWGCCVSVIGIEYTDGTFSPLGTKPVKVESVVPIDPELPSL